MPEQFETQWINAAENTVLIRVRGKLDARTTPDLTALCQTALERRAGLILNLSGVSFIASSGIGGLLALVEDFREAQVPVRLTELSPAVRSIIDLLNLAAFLTIDDTEGDSKDNLAA